MFGECHAHIFMNGYDYRKAVRDHADGPDESLIREAFREYQQRRVFFVRDGGDHFGVSAAAKKIATEFDIDYRTPIFAIYHEGHYGRVVGRPYRDMAEYAELVRQACEQGADFIKIITTGIMTFRRDGELSEEPLPSEEVKEMVHIVHESGRKVMSHTNGAEAVIAAAEAGVDSVEHGNFQNEESLEALAESHAVWVPTTVTVRNLIGCGRFDNEVLTSIWEGVRKNIRRGTELGIPIALGSDAGAYMVRHGSGICQEYENFREIFPGDGKLDERLKAAENHIHEFKT